MASLLIVDDDPTFLDVLSELFSGEHLCHTAATAEEAVESMSSHDYDVIVTDVSMPGMSGEDLLGFVKAHRPGTPVVFISGSTNEERAERLLTKGAFDYLQKPVQLEEITRRVARAVAHCRRRPPGVDS
jgi:DNA-binding NtrC family response regulator